MDLYILCLMIFFGRIVDVSLGAVRTVLMVKNRSFWAAMIGFAEALFWFLIVKEALVSDNKSLLIAIAYASGYAAGTFFGTIISDKFVTGFVSFQVVLSSKNNAVVDEIRNNGFGVSVITTKGHENDKYMLMMEVNKKQEKTVRDLIRSLDKSAFIVVKESKIVQNGFFK